MITHILHPWQDPATVGLIVVPAPRVDFDPRTKRKRRHRYAWQVDSKTGLLQWGRAPWPKSDPYNFLVEHEESCPLGAVGDRVQFSNGMEYIGPVHEVTSVDCKLVGKMTEGEAVAALALEETCFGWTGVPGDLPDTRDPEWSFEHSRWQLDYPDHPWDTSWAWFVGVEVDA